MSIVSKKFGDANNPSVEDINAAIAWADKIPNDPDEVYKYIYDHSGKACDNLKTLILSGEHEERAYEIMKTPGIISAIAHCRVTHYLPDILKTTSPKVIKDILLAEGNATAIALYANDNAFLKLVDGLETSKDKKDVLCIRSVVDAASINFDTSNEALFNIVKTLDSEDYEAVSEAIEHSGDRNFAASFRSFKFVSSLNKPEQ